MSISRDSQREVARVKREMLGAGKGDNPRPVSKDFTHNYPECNKRGCQRLRVRNSDYCKTHQQELEEGK